MSIVIERAVTAYLRAWCESDPTARTNLIESCWSIDGRLVSASREIRGRTALAETMTRFAPQLIRIRLLSVIDAGRTSFRFRGVADLRDGTSAEAFDAGEVDAAGRIALILTFAGPLADAGGGAVAR
ncbi:MAG: hypothetical protein WKG01_00240 [Kofleriaceae bacterium]